MKTQVAIIEKLSKVDLPAEEKKLIVENGLRYRILEAEKYLRKTNSEIAMLEKYFGMSFDDIQKEGLPDNADYRAHEYYIDLQALVQHRMEIERKLASLNKLYDSE